jgi:anti-sigma regulatory factor (Ser/Thr protein kinase)
VIRASTEERVTDASEVASARRTAMQHAHALHLSAHGAARAGLVATELATNLIKHGDGGTILFATDDAKPKSLTLIAVDRGRGIANVGAAKRDGFSTAGSPGTGLGAMERATTSTEIFTLADRGTAVICTIDDEERASPVINAPSRISVAGVSLPKRGEDANGDAWGAVSTRDVVTIALADGLGHGPQAAMASTEAMTAILSRADLPLEDLFRDAHAALRSTRGAAVSVARIHASVNRIDFIGIGNVAGTIVSDDAVRKTVSLPGIVGHEMRKLSTFSYPWAASSVLVMQSDGVSANWNPAQSPGLMQHGPALIAAVLYRDHHRTSDDATVVVAKAS